MATRKAQKCVHSIEASYLTNFVENQALQLMGGMLGISVGIWGKDIVKKAFSDVVKASRKPGFWEAFGGAVDYARAEVKTAKPFKKLGKCFVK